MPDKKDVSLMPSFVTNLPQPPLRKAEEYLAAYKGYAYTAISSIAQEVASIDLRLFKKKIVRGEVETDQIIEHESLSLLHFANPLMTFYDLIEATQIYLELVGEGYWLVLKDGTTPRELWPLRPDWVKVIPSKETIIDSYVYTPGGNDVEKVTIPREDIIPFKYFNPQHIFRGKGSIQAAAMAIDIQDFSQQWNRNFFFNSALPGLVFTTDKAVSDSTVKRFMQQWQATYQGRNNPHKIAFLGGGFKAEKLSINAKDMDFAEQQKMMRDDILAVFKVPKTVLGLTDDVNRANAEATTKAFMERVITPRMIKLSNTLNEFYLPMFGEDNIFFDFTDPAPEDTEQKLRIYQSGLQFGWLTPNEVRERENLEPVDGGDVLLPASLAPIQTMPEESKGQSPVDKLLNIIRRERKEVVKDPKKKKFKHMVKIPPKRLAQLQKEKLQGELASSFREYFSKIVGNGHSRSKPKPKKDDAVEDFVVQALNSFKDRAEKEKEKIANEAKLKAEIIIAEAKEQAKEEAEKEKKSILDEIKELRDKARRFLGGQ